MLSPWTISPWYLLPLHPTEVKMTCLNTETKSTLVDKIEHSNIPSSEAQILAEFIEELPICEVSGKQKSKKGKRPLSTYNIFLSSCLKVDKMEKCIPVWRMVKECIKNGGNLESCKEKQGY